MDRLQNSKVNPLMKQSSETHAEYDSIADGYSYIKANLPVAKYVEVPSMLNLAGNVKGLRVLDLACGDGKYARLYKDLGAYEVIGVDLSSEMIKIAKTKSNNIVYYTGDATKLEDFELGRFDLVAASYLLNYATSVDMLKSMISNIKLSLRPKGRFITINTNPMEDPTKYELQKQYSYHKTMECKDLKNPPIGAKIKYIIKGIDGYDDVEFYNYFMPAKIIQEEFEKQGFTFRFVKPTIADNPLPKEFWNNFHLNYPAMLMEAVLK